MAKPLALQHMQEDFLTYVRGKDAERIPKNMVEGKGVNIARRFSIYRNTVYASLANTLAAAFPVTCQLVGERFFHHMAKEAVQSSMPRQGCLQDYGAEFPDFIARYTPLASLPYLADVARLEWALHRAYWYDDVPALTLEDIRALPQEQYAYFRLQLHSAATLLESAYAIHAVWQAHQDGSISRKSIDITEGPDRMLVTRVDGETKITLLTQAEWQFLSACHTPATLDQAAIGVLAQHPDYEIDKMLIRQIELNSFAKL